MEVFLLKKYKHELRSKVVLDIRLAHTITYGINLVHFRPPFFWNTQQTKTMKGEKWTYKVCKVWQVLPICQYML